MDISFKEAQAKASAKTLTPKDMDEAEKASFNAGRLVGAYYVGIIESGMPAEVATKLAENYNDFLLDQMRQSAAGVRAVRK